MRNKSPTTLRQMSKRNKRDALSRQQMAKTRLVAVQRVLAGEAISSVISDLKIHRSSLYRWLKSYHSDGNDGLTAKPITGRPKQANVKKSRFSRRDEPAIATIPKHNERIADNGPVPKETSLSYRLEQLVLSLNQSVIEPQYPLFSFLSTLSSHMGAYQSIIALDMFSADSVIYPLPIDLPLQAVIAINQEKRIYWQSNPFLTTLSQPGNISSLDEFSSQKEFPTTEFYLRLLKPNKIKNALAMCFARPDSALCMLLLLKQSRKPFTQQDRKLLSALRPHLECAIATHIRIRRNDFAANALTEATDHLEIATFILDGYSQVVYASKIANQMLNEKQNFSLERNKLIFLGSDNQKEFEHAVEQSIAWRQAPLGNKPIRALRFEYSLGKHLGLLVQPITPPNTSIPFSIVTNPQVVVYIGDPQRKRPDPQQHLIAQLFLLSASEAKLTSLLVNGHELDEICGIMKITKTSARTYLQHIYEKTGVSGRTGLVQLVMKSVALIG